MKKSGHVLIYTLILLTIGLILTAVSLAMVQFEHSAATKLHTSNQALNLAEAGVDYAIRQLNQNQNYPGSSDVALGTGVFTVTVTGNSNNRVIESTGYIPNSSNPRSVRKIKVNARLSTSNAEFFYGIQVDQGGIQFANNSQVVGNVYSNGNITGNPGALITGDAVVAGGIQPNPNVEWTTHSSDFNFATISGNRDVAQSFTALSTNKLVKVAVYLGKVGNPSSNITLRVTADNGGKPATTDIGSGVIAASSVGITPSWIEVAIPQNPDVTSNTKYWIVLDYSSQSSTDYWNWRIDQTDGYSNNTGRYTSSWSANNASWANANGDMAFRVWIGGTVNKIENMTVGSTTTGTARANSFISTTVHGSSCPNQYCVIDNAPQEPLPISDGVIQDWKNDATAGGVITGDYLLTGTTATLGPKRIDGNLILDNNASLTMTGTIYVTGNITLSNNCHVNLDSGYGNNSGIIVADGTVSILNNCAFQDNSMSTGYVMLLTTRDAKTEVSLDIANNSAGVIYYAAKSRIRFAQNSQAKEATAWGINLENNAVVTYDSGLASTTFSSGPGGGWRVEVGSWREVRSF